MSKKIIKNSEDDLNWIGSLGDSKEAMGFDVKQQFQVMQSLAQIAYVSGDTSYAKSIIVKMRGLEPKVKELLNQKNGPAGEEE